MGKSIVVLDAMYANLEAEWLLWTDDDVYLNPDFLNMTLDAYDNTRSTPCSIYATCSIYAACMRHACSMHATQMHYMCSIHAIYMQACMQHTCNAHARWLVSFLTFLNKTLIYMPMHAAHCRTQMGDGC